MSLPGNGIFVVQGEMAMLFTSMRRSSRWGSHSFPNDEYDVLMRTFQDLKTILNQVDDLRLLDPATYLSPFLEVIRSKDTNGPVTSLALSAIHKFLSYGLIDPTHPSVPATVEDIADAVTHARFVGTDHSSDGVVLMKILQVLRTLMLSPEGAMLTDESVCEIMLSCFRICFETRLTELLRRNAEQCLRDMTQLIFMRLPQFSQEDALASLQSVGLSLKKRDKTAKKKGVSGANSTNSLDRKSSLSEQTPTAEVDADRENRHENIGHGQDKNLLNEAEITIEPGEPIKSPAKKHGRHSSMDLAGAGNTSISQLLEKCVSNSEGNAEEDVKVEDEKEAPLEEPASESAPLIPERKSPIPEATDKVEDYVNPRGIRFTSQEDVVANLQPYGLLCVRELFRFLISLCNPLDSQNTSAMVHLGLSLIGTALEVGVDQIAKYPSLLYLVKDPLCRNLLSLLSTEKISIFALDLQVSFLLFEALRFHLKYQMEAFFKKLIEIISTDTTKAVYELREIQHLALESIAQMFRIPGLCTELYLNYDCDVYCMNVFEEVTKLLSKNVVSSSAHNIHSLSLEALLTIIEAIENGLNQVKVEEKSEMEIENDLEQKEIGYDRGGQVSLELGGLDDASVVSDHVTHDISQYVSGTKVGRHRLVTEVPSEAELDNIRNIKKWVTQGTELFNQKPERGIEFLQEHGVLTTPLDPREIAMFLRENPDLDKKMIGEYICKRSSRGDDDEGPSILSAFADSFDYTGLRIDQALRHYLETFRLPGEAPLIFLVMEKFAERWHSTNGSPFANTDAAFRLAYAVIMLNMDQHNHNAKKLNVPMTVEDFVKNLRGCNGSGDFDQAMLEAVYLSIKNEEMIMPAERVGAVRDAYLWRLLQRRSLHAKYRAAAPPEHYNRLFATLCPNAMTALSAAFERAPHPTQEEMSNNSANCAALVAFSGLERCTNLLSRLTIESMTVDTMILTMCKFTGLLNPPLHNPIAIGVMLGQSSKAQIALRGAMSCAARQSDFLRDSWRPLLDLMAALCVCRLLPQCLLEAEDYLSPEGRVPLIREASRSEAGLLSSLYSYIALGESGIRTPNPHEKALIDVATDCVAKCNFPGVFITETKFLQLESLKELIHAMVTVGTPPDPESVQLNPQLEDVTIFYLELLGQTLMQNRDRLSHIWESASAHYRRVLHWAGAAGRGTAPLGGAAGRGTAPHGGAVLARALTALLRTCARLMRCSQCASAVLDALTMLFDLPYAQLYSHALLISSGLYELVKTSAQNVHTEREWQIVFSLLLASGAGYWHPNVPRQKSNAASSRSDGSEDESDRRLTSASSESELSQSPNAQGWIVVNNKADSNQIALESLRPHRGAALARCCEALALVVRDVAHVTPHNCRAAVAAVRAAQTAAVRKLKSRENRSRSSSSRRRGNSSSDDEDESSDQYHMICMQLLDLMHTLHSRTAQIFKWWRDEADGQGEEEYDLWEVAWQPLLQGIALFCMDSRKQLSSSAIAYLQRALLVPGLAGMGGAKWEACFDQVLFPLVDKLAKADTQARANTILCKVFLQHLSALSPRPRFPSLWLRIVSIQQSLVKHKDDPYTEAAVESLKNMILVMREVKIFSNSSDGYNDLWYITWDKIGEFLPNLKEELFPEEKPITKPSNTPSTMQSIPSTFPTLMPFNPASNPLLPQPPNSSNPIPSNPFPSQSPVNLINVPNLTNAPTLVAPIPVVPVRPKFESGLASSVLLQPLNEMISTPIGMPATIVPPQIPILYPQTIEPMPDKTEPYTKPVEPTSPQTVLDISYDDNLILPEHSIEHGDIYAEYLTNPYNEAMINPADLTKTATLYEPNSQNDTDDIQPNLLEKQKSYSVNVTPMHSVKPPSQLLQFGSIDNLKQESSMFNFTSYFGGNSVPAGAEVFDALVSKDG